jgi:exopolysaccharide biosynthesis WecB/TagA/CpsF family protein
MQPRSAAGSIRRRGCINVLTAAFAFSFSSPASEATPARIATRDIGGIAVAALSHESALAALLDAIAGRHHLKLAFCNAHLVNLAANDRALRRQLAGFLILADGIGVDIASRLLHGKTFPANLNGTDFTPALLKAAPAALRVGLIGGRPGVAERAAARLAQEHPRHAFTVVSHGFFSAREEAGILAKLEADPPDILLVAFGNPLQERWISEKLSARHCTVAAGVGALFDFMAGEVTRAPTPIRRLRLEWLYRLWLEPGRLWRRYILGNPVFLTRILHLRLSAHRSAQ